MSHFRDRVILPGPGNIPQLPSGVVNYTVPVYSIGLPLVPLAAVVPTESFATDLGAVNIYTATPPTADLGALVPTQSVTATSP